MNAKEAAVLLAWTMSAVMLAFTFRDIIKHRTFFPSWDYCTTVWV